MNISLFLLHLAHGGVEKASSALANALCKRGHQITLYVSYPLPIAYALDERIKVVYLTNRIPNREAFKRAVKQKNPLAILSEGLRAVKTLYLKRKSFLKVLKLQRNVVVMTTRHEQNRALSRARLSGVFKIAQLHHDVKPGSKMWREIEKGYAGLDVVTALTEELVEELSGLLNHKKAPQIVWMPNFLESGILDIALPKRRSQSESGLLISVCRFETEKGVDRLLDVWSVMCRQYPNWVLEIIGDGSQYAALKERVQREGLESQVRLPGMLSYADVLSRLRLADVFLLGSRTEGFGLVLLEAAAMGLPLIAYDVRSGPRSIIKHGENGFLIPDGDIYAFSKACTRLMDEENLRLEMGEKARAMVQDFTESNVVKRWEEILPSPKEATPIPQIIHYVWVGGAAKNKVLKRCIRSWKKHLPDFEIKEWNESNFDIESHPFVKEAYRRKKWAFVSDYIRAWALYHEGGVYLDTDNVVLQSLEAFRKHRAFVGFERPEYPFTACFGTEARHPLVKDILDYYDEQPFELDEANPLPFNNTISVSDLLIHKYGAKCTNQRQSLKEGIALYPDTVLCNPSADSFVIHVFTGSWLTNKSSLSKAVTKLKSFLNQPWKAALYARLFRNKA